MMPANGPTEIASMQHAGALLRQCFIRLAKELCVGCPINRLRETAEQFVSDRGGRWSPPLESCLTLAVNDRLLGPLENRQLEAGDVVTLDLSASLNGWWADCAVVLPVGKIEVTRTGQLIRTARDVTRSALSQIKADVEWASVVHQTRHLAETENLNLIDSLFGHGIGQELHESPRLSWKLEQDSVPLKLQTGMSITIEPAVTTGSGALIPTPEGGVRTEDGQLLMWFEETVAATDSGCRVLTQPDIPPEQRNLVLIGMPGTGKSTVGHALARRLGRTFVDLDAVIEDQEGRRLEEIIHEIGFEAFLDLEAEAAINFGQRGVVLATGGSVVYRPAAMLALRQTGTIIFLHTPLDELERRLSDLKQRGVVVEESQSVADLFYQREPLYECWYDLKIETAGHTVGETVDAIATRIK